MANRDDLKAEWQKLGMPQSPFTHEAISTRLQAINAALSTPDLPANFNEHDLIAIGAIEHVHAFEWGLLESPDPAHAGSSAGDDAHRDRLAKEPLNA